MPAPAFDEPRRPVTMTVRAAINYSGLGKTSIFQLISTGRVASVKRMGRRLIVTSSLESFLLGDRGEAQQ